MKCLKTFTLLVLIIPCTSVVFAQKTTTGNILAPRQAVAEKPKMFDRLPEKFNVSQLSLDHLFTTQNPAVSVPVKDGLSLEGFIVEKVQQNPNVISINIRLSGYDSSLLNISRIMESDLTVSYNARVMNIKSGDILLLKKENNQFYFTREKQSLVTVE